MTTTGLVRRVAALTARLAPPDDYYTRRLPEMVEKPEQARRNLLVRIPADLHSELAAGVVDPDRRSELTERADGPFARWATMPAGFEYPREVVEWLPHPPRGWFLGHACGRCRSNVPLLVTWSDDPDPPKSILVFPICPACGGPISYAAGGAPGCGHMTLSARLAKLEGQVPRRRVALPADPAELIRGLATGRFTATDNGRTGYAT